MCCTSNFYVHHLHQIPVHTSTRLVASLAGCEWQREASIPFLFCCCGVCSAQPGCCHWSELTRRAYEEHPQVEFSLLFSHLYQLLTSFSKTTWRDRLCGSAHIYTKDTFGEVCSGDSPASAADRYNTPQWQVAKVSKPQQQHGRRDTSSLTLA